MALAVGWMNRKLGWGQSEDEPASARVCRGHAEYVREERTDLLSLRGEHDRMYSGDHDAILANARPVSGSSGRGLRAAHAGRLRWTRPWLSCSTVVESAG